MNNTSISSESDEKLPHPRKEIENVPSSDLVDAETERKLVRKLDWRIIPLVMWMYLMSFMDRVNIGNARLYGLEQDLNLESNQYQLAVSILFVTYCLFEAPSNMVLKKLKPARYLAFLTFAWGLVATMSAFVQNLTGLIICRLLLGLFEAGLFPGLVVYLTIFYNKKHIALRTAYLFATAAVSGAAGGLVAYCIGFMDDVGGWRAWRWIFLLNGIPTVLTAFVIPFVLPNTPESASFLSEEDRRNIVLLRSAEVGQTLAAQEFHWEDAKAAMKDWKTYVMAVGQYCSNSMLYSFSIFLPTIIDSIGIWSVAQVQALTIPVYALGAISYIVTARISDRIQQRGIFVVVFTLVAILGYVLLIANINPAASFAGTFLVAMGCYLAVGMPMAWLASNNPRYAKRAVANGIQLTLGNSAGVAAPFLFSDQYAPSYYPGYGGSMGLLCLSTCLFLFMHLYWKKQNKKRMAGDEDWKMEGKTEEEVAEMGDESPRFMYTV